MAKSAAESAFGLLISKYKEIGGFDNSILQNVLLIWCCLSLNLVPQYGAVENFHVIMQLKSCNAFLYGDDKYTFSLAWYGNMG